jgi:hypothetical protein
MNTSGGWAFRDLRKSLERDRSRGRSHTYAAESRTVQSHVPVDVLRAGTARAPWLRSRAQFIRANSWFLAPS